MEKKEGKRSCLELSKSGLTWLAILVLAGLFTALTVLMIKIEKDNEFIITSLLPLTKKAFLNQELPEWKDLPTHSDESTSQNSAALTKKADQNQELPEWRNISPQSDNSKSGNFARPTTVSNEDAERGEVLDLSVPTHSDDSTSQNFARLTTMSHTFLSKRRIFKNFQTGPIYPSAVLQRHISNLPVPFTSKIPMKMSPGKIIYIQGIPKSDPYHFEVNILCGPSFEGHDIALHFDVRFNQVGRDRNAVVRNTMIQGVWGTEEREIPEFPFIPNVPFEMKILCEQSSFKITVNGLHFVEFDYRVELERVSHIKVLGDTSLTQVRFE